MSAARTTCRARPARASKRFSSSKAASSHGLRAAVVVRAGPYDEELVATAKTIASAGRGILAMDESNGTCGKRLETIGLDNTEENRKAYRTLLVATPGLSEYVSGAILFEETLYQDTTDGKPMVDVLNAGGIIPGIKVDKVRSQILETTAGCASLILHVRGAHALGIGIAGTTVSGGRVCAVRLDVCQSPGR